MTFSKEIIHKKLIFSKEIIFSGQGTFLFERELFAHCLLIAELIKLRKFFTHCQLKEVFIKLKQVSEIIRKLKKKFLCEFTVN